MKTIYSLKILKIALLPAIIVIVAFTSGCATLSKGECIEADWYEIGIRDGSSGKPRSVLDSHREACKKHGVAPNREHYYAGRTKGINTYCTPDNGFLIGKQGGYYKQVCPIHSEQDFLNSYNLGKEIYNINRDIATIESKIVKLENELDKKETKKDSRIKIREEIRTLDRKHKELREKMTYFEEKNQQRMY